MEAFREYVIQPGTLISLAVFLFCLGGVRADINNKIKENSGRITKVENDVNILKEDVKNLDIEEIKITLAGMQKDLSRIKLELQKKMGKDV